MEIVEGSIKYYPPLSYRRHSIHLLFGWIFFYQKDAWSCDIQLYKPEYKRLNLVWWRRYNTLFGMAWSAIILGVPFKSAIARKACKLKGSKR